MTEQQDLDDQLRAAAVGLWEEWAHHRYPEDVGDEGGWDESTVDEWLAEVRRAVLAAGDVRRTPRHPT